MSDTEQVEKCWGNIRKEWDRQELEAASIARKFLLSEAEQFVQDEILKGFAASTAREAKEFVSGSGTAANVIQNPVGKRYRQGFVGPVGVTGWKYGDHLDNHGNVIEGN